MATSVIPKSLASEVNTLGTRFEQKGDGSMHDITESGVYYLRNSVTDKPTTTGGLLVISMLSSGGVGLYAPLTPASLYHVQVSSGNWVYVKIV